MDVMNALGIVGVSLMSMPFVALIIFVIVYFYIEKVNDFKEDHNPVDIVALIMVSMLIVGFVLVVITTITRYNGG